MTEFGPMEVFSPISAPLPITTPTETFMSALAIVCASSYPRRAYKRSITRAKSARGNFDIMGKQPNAAMDSASASRTKHAEAPQISSSAVLRDLSK